MQGFRLTAPRIGATLGQAAVLIALAALLATGPLVAAGFPSTVSYQGEVLDAAGAPLAGTYNVTFHYWDQAGEELLAETIRSIAIVDGKFQAQLGTGSQSKVGHFDSLKSMFAVHPEVDLEVEIEGTVYEPRQSIIAAGHSLKSRLVAAGVRAQADGENHWKHYEAPGGATAVQSGVLAPKGARPQPQIEEGTVWRRPYTLPVVGPVLSRAVRDLPRAVPQPIREDLGEINPQRHESLYDEEGHRFGTATVKIDDYLAGPSRSNLLTPALNFSFEGVSNVSGVLPPDTEAAVGPNHYVQVVNLAFSIYNKSGTLLSGPSNTNTLWAGFGGPCQTDNSGDAIFMYDQQADRFVLTQFAVAGSHQSVCFAISQTPDPTGSYFLYEVVTPRFPDYYKMGVWPSANNNAYFFGTNSGFQGQYDVFAVDRANMVIGAAARPMQFFQNFSNLMMPADVDGAVGPAANAPGIFYTFRDGGESYFGNPATDSLDVYEFDVNWTTPANTTMTLVNSITPAQGLAAFNWTVCGFFVSNCIPQPGTSQGIDSQSWWPMQRLVYRNFGSHETLVGAWTVDVNSTGNRAAPRWFELRDTGSGWTMFQQGTHSPDSIHRWMPSIAMDGNGNIAIGYNRGDGSNFASIYYATRLATDPLNTMQAEALLFTGTGSQTSTSARWGDYASMELDPADDCTFWYTTEYLASTSNANWRTRVGVFTIPGCGGPINNAPVVSITAPANNSTFDVGTSVTFSGTANDTEDGNLTAGLSWTSSIDGAIGSGGSFSTSGLSVGSHLITASVTDSGGVSGSDSITVNINDPNSNGPQNAVYDAGLGVPACAIAGSSCDSLALLNSRDNLSPAEPNQPNTLDVCNDGTSGTFHSDESNDKIVVSTTDGSDMTEGATVRIDATVYAWNTGSQDTLDLYYAADANSPSWVFITSIGTPAGGVQTLSATYTLPTGTLQAVRANFRYQGSASTCSGGNWDDHDDLVFAVKAAGGGNTAPNVTITAPANGSSFVVGSSVTFSGTANDTEDGDISANLAWTSSIDGAIGSGASFSTTGLSLGTHTITASVTDSGGLSGSDAISVTIDNVPNTAPTVTITSPPNPTTVNSGDSVTFTATATDPEDGNIAANLSWSSNLDGVIGSGASFSTTTLSVGTHTVTASVTDSGGASGSDTVSVTVNALPNDPPTVTITSPANPTTVNQGDSVTFTATATDTEDGNIAANLSWSSNLDGVIGSGASFSTTTLSVGTHTVTASVTDSGGASGSDTVSVTVNSVGGTTTEIWMSFRSNTAVPGVGTVRDEDIVSYNEDTGVWTLEFDGSDVGLGGLEISGFEILPGGDFLLSFTAAGTVGGMAVDDSDIVRFTPTSLGANTAGSFSFYFDGSDVGLSSSGEDITAIALASDGRLIISTLGSISANGASGKDEDLWIFTGTLGTATSGSFAQYFDGSDVGLNNSGGEDVDAAALTASGNLLFSTVGDFSVTGVSGTDEDVVEFSGTFGTSTSGTFTMRLDLSTLGIAAGEDIGSLQIVVQ